MKVLLAKSRNASVVCIWWGIAWLPEQRCRDSNVLYTVLCGFVTWQYLFCLVLHLWYWARILKFIAEGKWKVFFYIFSKSLGREVYWVWTYESVSQSFILSLQFVQRSWELNEHLPNEQSLPNCTHLKLKSLRQKKTRVVSLFLPVHCL